MDHLEREMRNAGQRAEVKRADSIGLGLLGLAALVGFAGWLELG